MMRGLLALSAAVAMARGIACAAPLTLTPKALTLQIGGRVFGKIVAVAASSSLSIAHSTCFTASASTRDVLKITALNKSNGAKESRYTMDVRAQRPGNCAITFASDADTATVNVTVLPEEP